MADSPSPPRRRIVDLGTRSTLAVALFAAAIAALGAVARQQGVPRYRTIWAEDGGLFAQCPMLEPSPLTCVVTPYDGWLHLVPRLLGWAADVAPPSLLSYTLTGLAALALAGCAFLVARAVTGASDSAIAGLVAGISVALVYPAGAEVAGNITNLPWAMFAASAVIVICSMLGRPMDGLDAAFLLLTLASSPFGLLIGALVAMAWLIRRRVHVRPWLVVVGAAIVGVQLAVSRVSPRNAIPDLPVTLASPIGWLWDLLFVKGPFGGRGLIPGWLVGVATVVVLVLLIWKIYRSAPNGTQSGRRLARWSPLLAIGALAATASAVFGASTYLNQHVAARYEYVPAVALVVALPLGVALLARSWTRSFGVAGRKVRGSSVAVALSAVVVLVGFATTFRVTTGASPGPSYPAEFREAIRACAGGVGSATVPISPLPTGSITRLWQIQIPCDRR
jgi:hypothetical protein